MDASDRALRVFVRKLLRLGITQKAIAVAIGANPPTFNKWLKREEGVELKLKHGAGMDAFVQKLRATINEDWRQPGKSESIEGQEPERKRG